MSAWKKIKKHIGGIVGTIVMPGIGTAIGDAMDQQTAAVKKQADIAEDQAAQQTAYYQQMQDQAEKDEAAAKTAAAATTANMKRGLSDFLFNNDLLGIGKGKRKLS